MSIVHPARTVSVLVLAFACASATAAAAGAQTWEWDVAARGADQTTVPAHARVDLGDGNLFMTYSAQAGDHSIPITVCRARLAEVASVQTVTNAGQPFLYVVMKPKHAAACGASREPVALMPIGTDPSARMAVATIANALQHAAPPARVEPAVRRPDTWVERDRWYAFVRLHNRGTAPLIVGDGAVDHCRFVAFGCGRFPRRPIRIAPGSTATLATLMIRSARGRERFSYWYAARNGAHRTTGSGNSGDRDGPRHTIPARELHRTEVAAAALRTSQADPPRRTLAARLVRRGSTRLGSGQRGIARVRVRVGADGLPKDASIVSVSNHALTAAALEVAVSSTYAPAIRRGRPENADYVATFRF